MNTDFALARALDAVHHLADPEPPWTDILESARRLIASESSAFIMFDGSGALTTFQQRDMDPEGEHDLSRSLPSRAAPDDHARRLLESRQVRRFTSALQQALARRRDAAAQWLDAAESAFGAFGEATCLVTGAGVVLRLSPKAEQLLSRGAAALRLRYGKPWHRAAKVRDALSLALVRAAGAGSAPARLGVPGEPGRAACSLELACASPRLRLGNEAMVFVRIRRNRMPGEACAEALSVAFDITHAEARVLAALLDGHSPAEHAQAHGVSIYTVRKQIAVLMDNDIELARKRLKDWKNGQGN